MTTPEKLNPDAHVYVFEHGPYVKVASLVETPLVDTDGVLSLIRVVDGFGLMVHGPDAPEQLPAMLFGNNQYGLGNGIKLVVVLVPGEARGSFQFALRVEKPSGQRMPAIEHTVHLEGGEKATNIIVDFGMSVDEGGDGLYWIDCLFTGKLIARVPLRIQYTRVGRVRQWAPTSVRSCRAVTDAPVVVTRIPSSTQPPARYVVHVTRPTASIRAPISSSRS
ncbi:MAG: hypothetical protein QM757_14720 [Paludibaculum sp.]